MMRGMIIMPIYLHYVIDDNVKLLVINFVFFLLLAGRKKGGLFTMSTVPLLPPSPAPRRPPLTRPRGPQNRNSFPLDQTQESRWATLLARNTQNRPYGSCSAFPLHQPIRAKPPQVELQPISPHLASQPVLVFTRQVSPKSPNTLQQPHPSPQPSVTSPTPLIISQQPLPTTPQPLVSSQQSIPGPLLSSVPQPVRSRPVSSITSFNRGVTSPIDIKLFNPSRRLNKSQSQLIMPRMKSLFSSGGNTPGRERKDVPRDTSTRSLAQYEEATSPEPPLRKCHTVPALSSAGAPQTKIAKERKGSKLDFLRRMSPSKSAVFTSSRLGLTRSPFTASEFCRLHRQSSLVKGEGSGCSRWASTASEASRIGRDTVFCKLCLTDVSIMEIYQLQQCLCRFCKYVSQDAITLLYSL